MAGANRLLEPAGRRLGGRDWAGPPAHHPAVAPRRPRLLAFQASCSPAPSAPDGCLLDEAPQLPACLRRPRGYALPGSGRRLGFSRRCLCLGGPITQSWRSQQAPPSLPTMWTTRARAWRLGATAEPAETGVRSAKPSGGSSPGTAAWVRGPGGAALTAPSQFRAGGNLF